MKLNELRPERQVYKDNRFDYFESVGTPETYPDVGPLDDLKL